MDGFARSPDGSANNCAIVTLDNRAVAMQAEPLESLVSCQNAETSFFSAIMLILETGYAVSVIVLLVLNLLLQEEGIYAEASEVENIKARDSDTFGRRLHGIA